MEGCELIGLSGSLGLLQNYQGVIDNPNNPNNPNNPDNPYQQQHRRAIRGQLEGYQRVIRGLSEGLLRERDDIG